MTPLARFELGNGLELWKVPVDWPKEQEVNARAMAPGAFKQLTDNIRRENRLESLPLCALVGEELQIISGHHRTRAARKAGLADIWVMVDVSGLPTDRIRSKQLSHNSLQGVDDADLIKKIFESIQDSEARIEAFIDQAVMLEKIPLNVESVNLDLKLDSKTTTILFLPAQHKVFSDALEMLKAAQVDEVFLATLDEYDTLVAAVSTVGEQFQITAVPTILAKMAEIAMTYCLEQKAKVA